MTVPAISPPFPVPQQAGEYVGTIVLACRLTRVGVGVASKVSDKLPYPAVLTNVRIWGNVVATGLADTVMLCELTEDNAPRSTALPVQIGDLFGWYPPGAGFDPANDPFVGVSVFNTTHSHDFDVWVPIPSSNWRLRTTLVQATAITPRVEVVYTIKKLRGLVIDPATVIRPRGTPEDPVCVRICDDGAPPPAPNGGDGPPTPPPPRPPPGPVGSLDPAALPLPEPSEIDPTNPDNELAYECAVDRLDRG